MDGFASGLYEGTVVHSRLKPVRHRLRYRVFSLLLDLDELPELDRRLRLFAHGRFALTAFHDADHGPGDGRPIRAWVDGHLAAAGLPAGGPVRVLCFPRVLGYAFNPLSVWFCHRPDGTLAAILHEVSNTFGQRHTYVIPAAAGADGLVRQTCDKRFYVSPFMAMETTYHFRIRPPDEAVAVAIHQTDAGGTVLHASLAARRAELSDRTLAAAWLRHPLMTAKVMAGIHWEAWRLWRKGLGIMPRPPGPAESATIVAPVAVVPVAGAPAGGAPNTSRNVPA
ncbi:DUF1365 domain-containing protein [Azospirillum halopraeferens]|uniref:DUF1365 domain-containing protein n=1 Tax=Azospirillum halopraeferens TaxID=34010 RepID=UPI0003FEF504|nr:DUF1365 domain-containing protein [Azospirillum halopraeferens]